MLKLSHLDQSYPKLEYAHSVPAVAAILIGAANCLTVFVHRHRSRKELAHLDQSLLFDIGLTAEEADQEASKWFWMS